MSDRVIRIDCGDAVGHMQECLICNDRAAEKLVGFVDEIERHDAKMTSLERSNHKLVAEVEELQRRIITDDHIIGDLRSRLEQVTAELLSAREDRTDAWALVARALQESDSEEMREMLHEALIAYQGGVWITVNRGGVEEREFLRTNRIVRHAEAPEREREEFQRARRSFGDDLPLNYVPPTEIDLQSNVGCLWCAERFPTRRALEDHYREKHMK